MGIVIAEQSISLDGFSAGPNVSIGNGMGDGGEELHAWMEDPESAPILARTFHSSGAAVVGRRMFDVGVDPWGDDPPFHMPVFVVTHRPRDPMARKGGTTYNFVTGGIEAALSRARTAAGDRDVTVLGGADIVRQLLAAGLVDELRIHLAHMFLGGGTRLFDRPMSGWDHLELRRTSVIGTAAATHFAFTVKRLAT